MGEPEYQAQNIKVVPDWIFLVTSRFTKLFYYGVQISHKYPIRRHKVYDCMSEGLVSLNSERRELLEQL